MTQNSLLELSQLLVKDSPYPYILEPVPEPVGYWRIGANELGNYGTLLAVYKKPTEEQIRNHYNLLGWEYVEVYL